MTMHTDTQVMPGHRLVLETERMTLVITSSRRGFDRVAILAKSGHGVAWDPAAFLAVVEPLPQPARVYEFDIVDGGA